MKFHWAYWEKTNSMGHQKIRPALVVSRVDHQLDLLRQSQVTTAILL
jgi:hypothetical protein